MMKGSLKRIAAKMPMLQRNWGSQAASLIRQAGILPARLSGDSLTARTE